MICPRCGEEGARKNGTGRCYCTKCGKFGVLPAASLTQPDNLPDGVKLRGTSTLVDMRTGDQVMQWVKTTADEAAKEQRLQELADSLAAELPRVKPTPGPRGTVADLMTAYVIGDPHVGMMAWREETGQDWDLRIASDVHCAAMASLVDASPATEQALVINLGDLFHRDGMVAETTRSKHPLDVDGRFDKMIDVGILIMRQCIESALQRHARVHVVNVAGNHDETCAKWVARVIAAHYENEPRVTVDRTPGVFNYYRWGGVLIGMHHGHACKPDALAGVMASDRAKDWGETRHRYWYTGHVHHTSRKEYPGVSVESFNTLASRDAYATAGGWRSREQMQSVLLHKTHGEVGRQTRNAAMFRKEAA